MTNVSGPDYTGSVIVTDEDLKEKVRQALAWHFWIPRDRIRVEINDGWATVRGTVEWIFQKSAIEDAISHVEGMRGVTNEVSVEQRAPERYYPHSSR